jgi:hypothetical protein
MCIDVKHDCKVCELKISKNRMLRKVFEPKKARWKKTITSSLAFSFSLFKPRKL